jgi:diguanylate cyclase (GGDEF)-like protein
VGIEDSDIKKTQEYPVSDGTIARLLQQLQQYQPKVIGLDIHRDVPQGRGREELLQQLEADNLILIEKGDRQDSQNYISPPPEISLADERVGFSDLLVDPDNIIRRNLMAFTPDGEKIYYSFSLRISLKYLQDSQKQVVPGENQPLTIAYSKFPRLKSNAGGYLLNDSDVLGWQTMLKYHSENHVANQVSLSDVLEGKIRPSQIEDKIVLIGYTAPTAKDIFATPYSSITPQANQKGEFVQSEEFLMPGVVIHAQMVSQILNTVSDKQPLMWFLPEWEEWLWIWGCSVWGGIIILRLNHPLWLIAAGAISVGGIWGIGYLLFAQAGWIPIVPAMGNLIVTATAILGYKFFWGLYHDDLTALPNRRLFISKLQQYNCQKEQQQHLVAVLFLDLDRFKMVNEGLGRAAGDYLLIAASQRLQEKLQGRGQLARVGGDEFAIFLKALKNEQTATKIANEMQVSFSRPFLWKGQDIYASVSVGIACNRTGVDFQSEDLLRDAHIAMYRAKQSGKARYEIYASPMREEAVSRWQIETELRHALEKKELELYYQPIVQLKTGSLAGFEALVRWKSVARGLVSPTQFIPVAEETGLIIPIGEWILKQACQQMQKWQQKFPHHPPLTMSVNLSGRQFAQPDLVAQVQRILDEVGLKHNSLKLEITESMMMDDVEAAIDLLKRLKDLGLRLSIDDFGTGYSSLSYLHRFPIDTLKVDQSFVRLMSDGSKQDKYTQIVRTVIMLGHNLALDVIAEGIETPEQMDLLKSLGCEYGQGYWFSKPLTQEESTKLIAGAPQW